MTDKSEPNATVLAYLAGVIDSDGFITVQHTRKANIGRARPNIYYALKVGISGTRTQPHELAAEWFGGKIARYVPKNERHRAQFQWCVTGPTAKAILVALLPHLRVKAEQATLGLAFQAMIERHVAEQRSSQIPPYRITREMQTEREALWRKIATLNQSRRHPFNRTDLQTAEDDNGI